MRRLPYFREDDTGPAGGLFFISMMTDFEVIAIYAVSGSLESN